MSKAKKKPVDDKAEKESKMKGFYEDLIVSGLENFGPTLDNTGMAYTALILKDRNLENLHSIFANFKQLQHVDLSNNNIPDFTHLSNITNLVTLNLCKNSVKDIKCMASEEAFPNLLEIDLSENKIAELGPIKCPKLTRISLRDNKIEKLDTFEGHPKINWLNLKGNKIQHFALKDVPELTEVYLNENRIKTMAGLDALQKLKVLHLRANAIEVFEGETFPNMESLEYLNIRENRINSSAEILKVKDLPKLKTYIFSFNPCLEDWGNKYLFEVIIAMKNLKRVNKFEITTQIQYQKYLYQKEKFEAEEAKRKEAEEAEKAKQAALEQQDADKE